LSSVTRKILPIVFALVVASAEAGPDDLVPPDLQVALLKKIVRYERGFVERTRAQVNLLIVVRAGSDGSERAAVQIGKAFEDSGGGGAAPPIRVTVHRFSTPATLRNAILGAGASIVYLTPGVTPDVEAIAFALEGLPAITVAEDGADVDRGAVLGFELVYARPKIVINVGQARRQGLNFNSDLFRLARVVK